MSVFHSTQAERSTFVAANVAASKSSELDQLDDVLSRVGDKIAPVWPLSDSVAVNPYAGFADSKFLEARRELQFVSDCESLMSIDYYREQFATGRITAQDIDVAVDELVEDGVEGAEYISVNEVVKLLTDSSSKSSQPLRQSDQPDQKTDQRFRTFVQLLDQSQQTNWADVIGEEISKHCAAHYDQGQASWVSPWKDQSLYQAWRSAAQHDRTFELLGVTGFRQIVADLPQCPRNALASLLIQMDVPREIWEELLLCEAFAVLGWSAWTSHQAREQETRDDEHNDFIGLLAIRLTYEYALSRRFAFEVDWNDVTNTLFGNHNTPAQHTDLLRLALLRASEIAYRRCLLAQLSPGYRVPAGRVDDLITQDAAGAVRQRKLAQLVFCIDVRSERIRRHLESTSDELETYGFAGFFGLPIEYVPIGETLGTSQVPALIKPHFQLHEEVNSNEPHIHETAVANRSAVRFLRRAWKEFQSSAATCFAFVESAGLFYALKLLGRTIRCWNEPSVRFDGVDSDHRDRLGPSLRGLSQQGVTTTAQVDMAESLLRNLGLVDAFARLVVFCGHGSQSENNPLKAGLDCGACGGHSGEPNARFAAMLLNQQYIRQALAVRGIQIPRDVHFVAASHNTTTDSIQFHDVHDLPASHVGDLQELKAYATSATSQTRQERLSTLAGTSEHDLLRRSCDWSELRPEWGLAGNAAFIAAPRHLTQSTSLDGRSFLHSYDCERDPEYAVLEQIMTAPLVVAHWINMQYYASTVDPQHFGSGDKTIHNVVGCFGVLSGNGGDLMTGLPWQSVHDGNQYQHHPLRLLAVLAAPREVIESIVAKHAMVENLLKNGWMQLIAVEDDNHYRYTERQTWNKLPKDIAAVCAS